MSNLFEHPLPVGKQEDYTFTFSDQWAKGAVIASANVTGPDNVEIVTTSFSGLVVQARMRGVTTGRVAIHCSVTLSDGRGRCANGVLTVSDC